MIEWDRLNNDGRSRWRRYAKAALEADELLRQQPDMLEGNDETN